jgi:hypothetical protein
LMPAPTGPGRRGRWRSTPTGRTCRPPGGAVPRHPRPAQLPPPALRSRLGPGR